MIDAILAWTIKLTQPKSILNWHSFLDKARAHLRNMRVFCTFLKANDEFDLYTSVLCDLIIGKQYFWVNSKCFSVFWPSWALSIVYCLPWNMGFPWRYGNWYDRAEEIRQAGKPVYDGLMMKVVYQSIIILYVSFANW